MLENFRSRVFREVAAQGSFRRAGEILRISQPAVTQQVQALEEEVGQRLLDRTGGRVRLTTAGVILLQHAERSEAALRAAQEQLAALSGELRGTLRLAASTTVAQYVLPPLLATFGRQHPGVALALESTNTEGVVRQLTAGTADLGMIEGPAHRSDLLIEPWLADELALVVPATHPWAGQHIQPAALREAPLLLREQGSGTRAVLEAALLTAGLRIDDLRVLMQLGSTEALLACIEAGLGIGFASRFALRRQRRLRTLALVRITGLRVRRTLHLVRPHGPEPAGIVGSFRALLLDYAQQRRRPTPGASAEHP